MTHARIIIYKIERNRRATTQRQSLVGSTHQATTHSVLEHFWQACLATDSLLGIEKANKEHQAFASLQSCLILYIHSILNITSCFGFVFCS